jgi:hypothetical protein
MLLNAVHLERDFAEEDDVGTEAAATGAVAHFCKALVDGVVFNGRAAAVEFAVSLVEFAMHVEEADGAGAFVEVVDVLRAEEEAVADTIFKRGKCEVGWIRLGCGSSGAAGGVELPDEGWIALPGFGSADVFNTIAGPEAVFCAEGGETAFGADASTG